MLRCCIDNDKQLKTETKSGGFRVTYFDSLIWYSDDFQSENVAKYALFQGFFWRFYIIFVISSQNLRRYML